MGHPEQSGDRSAEVVRPPAVFVGPPRDMRSCDTLAKRARSNENWNTSGGAPAGVSGKNTAGSTIRGDLLLMRSANSKYDHGRRY